MIKKNLLLLLLSVTNLLAAQNKYILTGGPCCGKTSVIRELEKRGYQICPEAYGQLYQETKANGTLDTFLLPTINQRWLILTKHEQLEAKLDSSKPAFLDRSVPDAIFYGHYLGLDMPEDLIERFKAHIPEYKIVFFFEPLPNDLYRKTEVRYEERQEAMKIHQALLDGYTDSGFTIIHVPFDTVEKRADFILDIVSKE